MQTFLPYPDFQESARCLDNLRLLNQRNEAQIICAHIFPEKVIYNCRFCWDKGTIPYCPKCKKPANYVACRTCMDKGMIPSCPKCHKITNSRPPGKNGWKNHPAVKMWVPYRWALLKYAFTICEETKRRGFDDSVYRKLTEYGNNCPKLPEDLFPRWLGDDAFHASHRSNLLRKNPIWYSQFNWTEPPDMPYVWPKSL